MKILVAVETSGNLGYGLPEKVGECGYGADDKTCGEFSSTTDLRNVGWK